MNRTRVALIAGGVLAAAVLAGAAYIWFSGGSGEPSTEVTAPPVAAPTTAQNVTTSEPAPDITSPEPTPDTTTGTDDATSVTFAISKEGSTASFTLTEELRGAPTVVVGATSEVAGEILVDFDSPADSVVGTVVINARTLATDSSFRDRAIRGEILESASDEFEFISFAPTAVEGLPESIGDTVEFTVTGDLTIRDITQPVTFAVVLADVTPQRLAGSATAEVLREDFDLNIPSVQSVANVSEEVTVMLEFVAFPAGS